MINNLYQSENIISPPDNRKKLINESDIDHYNREYFKQYGEEYYELYNRVVKQSEMIPLDDPFEILNTILDFYITELKKKNVKESNNVITLSGIISLKKELLKLIDIYTDKKVDKIKLISIMKACLLKL